ncbi:SAM-dependent methyltransferase [Streptomyces decoyicus]|uniref:SAM-dependent methyltransferase n=1 Tax=Streptomyces decoyicus TaxID=249567 RepID=UPI0038049FDA
MTRPLQTNFASVPAVGRVHNWLLGGKDNFPADRALGELLVYRADWLRRATEINRAYSALAAAHLVRQGIRQIVELGCGYPTPRSRPIPNVYQAAAGIASDATVVHIDHDRVVTAHAGAHLTGPPGRHSVVCADIRKMGDVFCSRSMRALDRRQPIAALIHDVLPWIPNDLEVHTLLTTLRSWLPPGSVISITHATADMRPGDVEDLALYYEEAGIPYRPRTADQIRALHAPWPLVEPGLVPTGRWHTDQLHAYLPDHESGAYAAVSAHPKPRYDRRAPALSG